MIRLCRNVIETAWADHAARRALVWECVALRHQLAVLERLRTRRPRFRPIDRLFWVFMSWWWPAWRDALVVVQPETVLRGRRRGNALIWKYRSHRRWRGGRPRIAVETRQLIREMARANFLWGAPRIHGELLKLGITVSQATVSRYMPRSPKDRRSQAWRTFVRNHAIAIVQSRSFDGHNWARDLLSQARSRSRVFTCRLSAFVVASVTDPSCWAAWYTVNPFLVAVALAPKSKVVAQRSSPATRKVDLLTIDRIRDPPTPHELKHHADCSSMRTTGKRLSSTRSSRSHGTASSSNRPYCQSTVRASDCHPRVASYSDPCFRSRYVCG